MKWTKILQFLCPHVWQETKCNKWYIATQRKCTICNRYQHLVSGISEPYKWDNGKSKYEE